MKSKKNLLFFPFLFFASSLTIPSYAQSKSSEVEQLLEGARLCEQAKASFKSKLKQRQLQVEFKEEANNGDDILQVSLSTRERSYKSFWQIENVLQSPQYLISLSEPILRSCSLDIVEICAKNSECFKEIFIDTNNKIRIFKLVPGEPPSEIIISN